MIENLDFLKDFLVLVVLGLCLCVGYIIKKIDFIPNKFIPLISGVMGVLFNVWLNGWAIDPNIMLGGLVSGLGATGMYELFEQLINKKFDKGKGEENV